MATSVIARQPDLAEPPRPLSGWKRLIKDSLLISGVSTICHALGVVTSLVLRGVLDPAQMGIWQGLKLALGYANYANFGAAKGAARELTVAMGRGETAGAQRGLNLAFTVNTLTSLGYAALVGGCAWWYAVHQARALDRLWVWGLALCAILVVLQRHLTFQITILRCQQAFGLTSQLALGEACATLVVCGAAAWLWGLPGLCGATLFVMLAAIGFLRWRGAVQLQWGWDRREVLRLTRLGAPILVAGAASTLFRTIDKWMILGCAPDGEFQLGCYSLALLVTGQIYGLANMLSLAVGPRYGELYGRTSSRNQVARLAARATELQAALLGLIGSLSIVVAGPLLGSLLPAYRQGVACMAWLVPGAVALGLALPAHQYLISVYHERRVVAVVLLTTIVGALGNWLAWRSGWGLIGAATVTSLSYVLYYLLLVSCSLWPQLRGADKTRYVAALAALVLPSLALALGLEACSPRAVDDLPSAALKGFTVLLAWCTTMACAWKWGGWAATWREEHA